MDPITIIATFLAAVGSNVIAEFLKKWLETRQQSSLSLEITEENGEKVIIEIPKNATLTQTKAILDKIHRSNEGVTK